MVKINESNLFKLLDGNKQFITPLHQKNYSCSEEQSQALWDDITNAAQNDNIKAHFIGSIIYIQEGLYTMSSCPKQIIIDGQQLLTTLMLLITALVNSIEENPDSTTLNADEIREIYLINHHKKGDEYYKLIFNENDKETFLSLLEGQDLPEDYSEEIFNNYNFFMDQVRKSSLSLAQIQKGIEKLLVVDISLDSSNDSHQQILESLNRINSNKKESY